MICLCLIFSVIGLIWGQETAFLGCFRQKPTQRIFQIPYKIPAEECVNQCRINYYKYSSMDSESSCVCNNFLGDLINDTVTCGQYCPSCDYKNVLIDVYSTGNLKPGPPREVQIKNVTDISLHVIWREPQSFTEINSYQIRMSVIHTYSNYVVRSPIWDYPNDTFHTEISNLQPGTQYNLSITAVSPDATGVEVTRVVETNIGVPDSQPEMPTIIKNSGKQIEISIPPATNNNGPITSYLVVVINDDFKQIFQEDSVKSYYVANADGKNYYIAAELPPEDINRTFMVGDGSYYGKYFNAPLDPNVNYKIISGITSQLHGITKRAFSNIETSRRYILSVDNDGDEISGDSPAVIIGLSVAIGLLSFMLIAGIVGFIILKSRVTSRRQRLSDNQELTLQGPMIEVENNGYIPEEEPTKANHYRNLKQKLRTIPFNQLKVEPTNLLGIGRFGRVNSGSIYENNTLIPIAAYSIQDKKLNPDDKKNMLRELDVLIRTGKHENIISLIGTCETPQMLFVVLEYVSMNLKDLLLGSRDSLPGRFSNMSESQALDIAIEIAKGMAHLEANKIIHKQLCARSIMIANGFIPKISFYGLAQYYSHNNLPDYTRWMSLEALKGQVPNLKSDIWSFGCLLWEICVLGGTPYGNFSNNEVPEKVIHGLRLPQMQYFNDDLYQIMLNCWQIDMDERPNFSQLIESLNELKENTIIPYLNFNLYSNFQYEQFYPDMEIAVRPVF